MLCLVDYANAACNTCGVTSKVACFSQTQYFACNSASQVDVSVLMTCTTGFCTDTIPPCSSGPAICQTAVAPIITTIAPVTTTTTIAPVARKTLLF